MSSRQLTLQEKWEIDAKAYENGAKVYTKYPQCKKCKNYLANDAMHCHIYKEQSIPDDVLFAEKECHYFHNIDQLNIEINTSEENRYYGAVFGYCVGDMVGLPLAYSQREERKKDPVNELRAFGAYFQPFGSWSDNTSFMLCLLDSLDSDDLCDQFKKNMIACYQEGVFTSGGELFHIKNTTKNRIENMIQPSLAQSEEDYENNALMYVLPIALTEGDLKTRIESISSLTNTSKRSKLACIIYTIYASRLYAGDDKQQSFNEMVNFIKTYCNDDYQKELRYFRRIFNRSITREKESGIKSTGNVVDTLEAVLWAFYSTNTYEKAILSSINLGGDTSTIAALTGGLAGIYYGYNGIPQKWIQNVLKKSEIADLAKHFLNK